MALLVLALRRQVQVEALRDDGRADRQLRHELLGDRLGHAEGGRAALRGVGGGVAEARAQLVADLPDRLDLAGDAVALLGRLGGFFGLDGGREGLGLQGGRDWCFFLSGDSED